MKRISKDDTKRKSELIEKITICDNKLLEAIQSFNAAQTEAFGPVRLAIEAYNDAVREADGFREDIANEIEGYMDERSDAWREGNKGQAYNEWLSQWQDNLEEVEIDEPQEIDEPETGAADRLGELEDEPNV